MPGHVTFAENQKGVSFDKILGPWLDGASVITLTDPYIRAFYQIRNFMELVETVIRLKGDDEEVKIHLVTTPDGMYPDKQADNFAKIEENVAIAGVTFTWELNTSGGLHARHIVTDTGWKISLDRGLDIYQQYEMNDAFVLANRGQQYRPCKAFEVTYLKVGE